MSSIPLLVAAAHAGDAASVRELLYAAAPPPPEHVFVSLLVSSGAGHTAVVQAILERNLVDPGAHDQAALRSSIRRGHVETTECLLRHPMVYPFPEGRSRLTPIGIAAQSGSVASLKALMNAAAEKGTQVNATSSFHKAMVDGTFYGHKEFLEELVRHYPGGTLEGYAEGDDWLCFRDCLCEPVGNNRPDLAENFLSLPGAMGIAERVSNGPSGWGCGEESTLETLRYVVERGGGVNRQTLYGFVRSGGPADLEWLLGQDCTTKELVIKSAGTAIWKAVEWGRLDVARWLQCNLDSDWALATERFQELDEWRQEDMNDARDDPDRSFSKIIMLAPHLSLTEVKEALGANSDGGFSTLGLRATFGDADGVERMIRDGGCSAASALMYAVRADQGAVAARILEKFADDASIRKNFLLFCEVHPAFCRGMSTVTRALLDHDLMETARAAGSSPSAAKTLLSGANESRNDPMLKELMMDPRITAHDDAAQFVLEFSVICTWPDVMRKALDHHKRRGIPVSLPSKTFSRLFTTHKATRHECVSILFGSGATLWNRGSRAFDIKRLLEQGDGWLISQAAIGDGARDLQFPWDMLETDEVWDNIGMLPGCDARPKFLQPPKPMVTPQ